MCCVFIVCVCVGTTIAATADITANEANPEVRSG